MENYLNNKTVCISECMEYDALKIKSILKDQLSAILPDGYLLGKKVVLKPNLILKTDPAKASTTDPSVVEAVASLAFEMGAQSVTIAESSGGPYSETLLRGIYKTCGIADAAQRSGAQLNYDTSFEKVNCKEIKDVNVISPILKADVIINIAKLKTHSLTRMTACVKNLFGVVPGIEKFEMHARYQNPNDLCEFFLSLCDMLHREKDVIDIVDAIVCMEGNGPTGGSPKKVGCILSSLNPFCLDAVCEKLIGFEGTVPMVSMALERGYRPSVEDIELIGQPVEDFCVGKLKLPDSNANSFLLKIPKFLQPRPVIDKAVCKACGDCVRSCPVKTISVKNGKPFINSKNCIKCYCCQELCHFRAVKIKKYFIYKLIK